MISQLILLSLIGMTLTTNANESMDRCLAVAMSGGGSRGAYEAGAMSGIYNAVSDKTSLEWDVVTGVSAGSINTLATIVFSKGQEADLVQFASDAWANMSSKEVWHNWSVGIAQGIFE